jgi:glycerol-3-phosphate acyltransferase PlsY
MAISVKQAIVRATVSDAVSLAIAIVTLRYSHVFGQPSWIVATAILVIGFAFGAYFGVSGAPSAACRLGIVAASVFLWVCCFCTVMYHFVNTYGS